PALPFVVNREIGGWLQSPLVRLAQTAEPHRIRLGLAGFHQAQVGPPDLVRGGAPLDAELAVGFVKGHQEQCRRIAVLKENSACLIQGSRLVSPSDQWCARLSLRSASSQWPASSSCRASGA